MLIGKFYKAIEIHRSEKIIVVKFLTPHRVISTCRAGGGLRNDLDLIFNHQFTGAGKHTKLGELIGRTVKMAVPASWSFKMELLL